MLTRNVEEFNTKLWWVVQLLSQWRLSRYIHFLSLSWELVRDACVSSDYSTGDTITGGLQTNLEQLNLLSMTTCSSWNKNSSKWLWVWPHGIQNNTNLYVSLCYLIYKHVWMHSCKYNYSVSCAPDFRLTSISYCMCACVASAYIKPVTHAWHQPI